MKIEGRDEFDGLVSEFSVIQGGLDICSSIPKPMAEL